MENFNSAGGRAPISPIQITIVALRSDHPPVSAFLEADTVLKLEAIDTPAGLCGGIKYKFQISVAKDAQHCVCYFSSGYAAYDIGAMRSSQPTSFLAFADVADRIQNKL